MESLLTYESKFMQKCLFSQISKCFMSRFTSIVPSMFNTSSTMCFWVERHLLKHTRIALTSFPNFPNRHHISAKTVYVDATGMNHSKEQMAKTLDATGMNHSKEQMAKTPDSLTYSLSARFNKEIF